MNKEYQPVMKTLDNMGIIVKKPISSEKPFILQVDTQDGPIEFLEIYADGRFTTGVGVETQSADKNWDNYPPPVRDCLRSMDKLGFRLASGRFNDGRQELYWIKTDGFGPDARDIEPENILILFFTLEGKPFRWEVKTNG